MQAAAPLSGESSATRQRRDIQGLRALAVLLVALDHAGVAVLRGGYVGVDVFFVLSGYLITGKLVASAQTLRHGSLASYLASFYAGRARRILPAAALTLVVTDVAASSLLNLYRAHQVLVDGLWATFFAANIHFASVGTNYFAVGQPPSPVQHFWSLAVEEQFYVVWPLLVALGLLGAAAVRRGHHRRRRPIAPNAARRLSTIVVVIIAASLAYAIYDTHHSPTSAYFSTPARAWELGLGALLSLNAERLRNASPAVRGLLGWGGLAAIIAASALYSASTPFPGVAALLPTIGAAALIAAGISVARARFAPSRVLSCRPLTYVGDRSYAFYLWHWPVLILAMEHAGHTLSLSTNLVLLAGAFLLSIVSYACIERPLHRTPRLQQRPALALWPAAILVVLLVTAFHWSDYRNAVNQAYRPPTAPVPLTAPAPLPAPSQPPSAPAVASVSSEVVPATPSAVVTAARAVTKRAPIPSRLTPLVVSLSNEDTYQAPAGCVVSVHLQASTKVCRLGDPSGRRSLVVFGDSHAQMWLPDIERFAQRHHYVVRPLIKLGCLSPSWSQADPGIACRAWYRWAVAQVRTIHPAVLLLVTEYEDFASDPTGVTRSLANINSFAARVRASTQRLIVLGDDPGQAGDQEPIDCLQRPRATMMTCSSAESQAQLAFTASVASVAEAFGGFLDTTPWFCYQLSCPMVVGHTIVYIDTNHITDTYADELAPLFDQALARVVAGHTPSKRTAPSDASSAEVVPGSPSALVVAVRAVRHDARLPASLIPPAISLSSADTYHAPPKCIAGPGQRSTTVCRSSARGRLLVVLGDSHAQMWLPDILAFARRHDYDVRPLIKLSCGSVVWAGAGSAGDCRGWYRWAVAQVHHLRPTLLLVVTHYADIANSPSLAAQNLSNLSSLITSVRSATGKLVILGDAPGQSAARLPIDCLTRMGATMASCSVSESQSQLDTTASVASEAEGSGVFLDTTPWFCYQLICPMVIGHTIAFVDSNHITATYADELAPLFQSALERAASLHQ